MKFWKKLIPSPNYRLAVYLWFFICCTFCCCFFFTKLFVVLVGCVSSSCECHVNLLSLSFLVINYPFIVTNSNQIELPRLDIESYLTMMTPTYKQNSRNGLITCFSLFLEALKVSNQTNMQTSLSFLFYFFDNNIS